MKLPSWLEQAVLRDSDRDPDIDYSSCEKQKTVFSYSVPMTDLSHMRVRPPEDSERFSEFLGGALTQQIYFSFFGEVLEAKQAAFKFFSERSVEVVTETMDWLLEVQKDYWSKVPFRVDEEELSFYEGIGRVSFGATDLIRNAQAMALQEFSSKVREAEEKALEQFYGALRRIEFESFDELEKAEKETAQAFLDQALKCAEIILDGLERLICKAKEELRSRLNMIAVEGNLQPFAEGRRKQDLEKTPWG